MGLILRIRNVLGSHCGPWTEIYLCFLRPSLKELNNTSDETATTSGNICYVPVHLTLNMCVKKVMRLILYKIIYSIIRLKRHYFLQNNIPLMQHTCPSKSSTDPLSVE
jgi:hypothetical protein